MSKVSVAAARVALASVVAASAAFAQSRVPVAQQVE
jgi:hypothetical protein